MSPAPLPYQAIGYYRTCSGLAAYDSDGHTWTIDEETAATIDQRLDGRSAAGAPAMQAETAPAIPKGQNSD